VEQGGEMITHREYEWNEKHYTRLLNHKVVAVGFFENFGELWPYITFESPTGERVDAYIQSDQKETILVFCSMDT